MFTFGGGAGVKELFSDATEGVLVLPGSEGAVAGNDGWSDEPFDVGLRISPAASVVIVSDCSPKLTIPRLDGRSLLETLLPS